MYPPITPPSDSEKNDYFFLPSLGGADDVVPTHGFRIGNGFGVFWSSSGGSSSPSADVACNLSFYYDGTNIVTAVEDHMSRELDIFCAWKFE